MNSFLILISVFVVCVKASSMPGGWSPAKDLNSPLVQQYSKKAVALVGEKMNSEHAFKLVKVLGVEQQVVAGMNYKYDMIIGPTECKKRQNLTQEQIDDCPLQKSGKNLRCSVTMWVQPWRDYYDVTKSSCKPDNSDSSS